MGEAAGGGAAQPHDALFRFVFGKPVHAASELRAVLPAALAERLDLVQTASETPPHRLAWLAAQIGPEAEEVYMSTADTLRAEGRAEEAARLLLQLLTRRFGPVPDGARERIDAASKEQLERWFERVLDAESLDEVFEAS
jgi:hypothetical protein